MLIAAKSDYLKKANEIYYELLAYEDFFAKEAKIIDYVKCALLRNEEVQDFYVDGLFVSVYSYDNAYVLYFDDYEMSLEIYDKQIVGMNIEK